MKNFKVTTRSFIYVSAETKEEAIEAAKEGYPIDYEEVEYCEVEEIDEIFIRVPSILDEND